MLTTEVPMLGSMMLTQAPKVVPSPDWWGALAGLHPLVIHFPIALVITAAVVEFIAMLARRERPASFTVIALVVGAVGGGIAAWSGWVLADEGYGSGWALDVHRWLGVVSAVLTAFVAVCALIGWFSKQAWATATVRAGILVCAVLVGVTGYFGGEMVWGPSLVTESLFPEETPSSSEAQANSETPATSDTTGEKAPAPESSEGGVSFARDVAPILDKHCWKCHGATGRAKAGIRLTNSSEMLRDVDGHPLVKPGDPEGSLVYKVVTLPRDDEYAMPPEDVGPGLDEAEISTIQEWIKAGAKFDDAATSPTPAKPAQPETPAQPAESSETTDAKPDPKRAAIDAALKKLQARGVPARRIAQNTSDLEFNANGLSHRIEPPFSDDDIELLDGLQPVLVDVDLSNTAVTDNGVARLAGFDALKTVKLKDTKTSDASARVIAKMPRVTVVNFYGTDLDDAGLTALAASPSIKTIYAGDSKVTDQGVAAALAAKPGLVVHHKLPSSNVQTDDAPATTEESKDAFKTSIEPILEAYCWKCHGPEGKPKANLRLATLEEVLAERDGVKLVDPGKPESSLLYERIALPRDADGAMPPRGPGLTQGELDAIKSWIAGGAT